MIDTQKVLLDAAVRAGVPRFIPSDFSLDFTNLRPGENRNLDLRREFMGCVDASPIATTTIFIGPFMDLLTDQMPMILFKPKWVLYWGSADQRMDFTTMDDTAAFTANAALDDATPRFLRIAGDRNHRPRGSTGYEQGVGQQVWVGAGGRSESAQHTHQSRPDGGSRRGRFIPGLAGYAIHARYDGGPGRDRFVRKRPVSRYALDDGERLPLRASGNG